LGGTSLKSPISNRFLTAIPFSLLCLLSFSDLREARSFAPGSRFPWPDPRCSATNCARPRLPSVDRGRFRDCNGPDRSARSIPLCHFIGCRNYPASSQRGRPRVIVDAARTPVLRAGPFMARNRRQNRSKRGVGAKKVLLPVPKRMILSAKIPLQLNRSFTSRYFGCDRVLNVFQVTVGNGAAVRRKEGGKRD
jgi:hypothetical protein